MSIIVFHDTISLNAHKEFEHWRSLHLTEGFFLNPLGRKEVMLHRADCSHLDFGEKVSLTAKRKVCSTEKSELRTWAFQNKVRIKNCPDCES